MMERTDVWHGVATFARSLGCVHTLDVDSLDDRGSGAIQFHVSHDGAALFGFEMSFNIAPDIREDLQNALRRHCDTYTPEEGSDEDYARAQDFAWGLQ